jgi:hypothetical protein
MQSRQVPVELLNKILNYLATKPYIEVMELIRDLTTLPENDKQAVLGKPITEKASKK